VRWHAMCGRPLDQAPFPLLSAMDTTDIPRGEGRPMLERLAETLPGLLQNNPGLAQRATRALLTIHFAAGPKMATARQRADWS
jgi:hypothetical protein